MKSVKKAIPAFFILFFLLFSVLFAPMASAAVNAEEEPAASIGESYVLDDLKNAVLNGRAFDKADYTFTENRDTEILSFAEYGYSKSDPSDYALYLYLYNPRALKIDITGNRHSVSFSAGKGNIVKYDLAYVNQSTEEGYEGMFFKFKVAPTAEKRTALLFSALDPDERVYRITELELSVSGNIRAFAVGMIFTYTGFAQGYGGVGAAPEGDLACKVDGFEDYAELKVKQTVYRPDGDYHEGEQSQLNSCWFTVPDEFFENNGALSAIVAQWYEYVTKPVFVTQQRELYDFFNSLHGGAMPKASETGFGYWSMAITDPNTVLFGLLKKYGGIVYSNADELEPSYHAGDVLWNGGMKIEGIDEEHPFEYYPENPYSAIFITDDYEHCTISAEQLANKLEDYSKELGGEKYAGKFSTTLFSNDVQPFHTFGYNHQEIRPEDERKLFSNYTTKSTWQKMWGGYSVEQNLTIINAIAEVSASDLDGADTDVAERLYINQNDVAALRVDFEETKKTKDHVILFRYGESNYFSIPTATFCMDTEGMDPLDVDDKLAEKYLSWNMKKGKFDGFISQQTCYLDFDIISLKFKKGTVETEIGAVMTPQNVFSDVTPPLDITYHNASGLPWYAWIIIVVLAVLLIILLILFFPVLKPVLALIGKGIWLVISAPFRFIAWVFRSIAGAVKKKKENKAQKAKKPEAKPKPQAAQKAQKAGKNAKKPAPAKKPAAQTKKKGGSSHEKTK